MENFIQLKKDNITRIGIRDAQGNDTGEFLEFDLEDIEFPLRLQKCEADHKKNLLNLKNQYVIIDKKEDHKGKMLLSWKEEEKIKALQEFYKKEEDALDLFLGKGGTRKLLNGRNPYFSMFEDISDMLEPILPIIQRSSESITEKIKAKYQNKRDDVIE